MAIWSEAPDASGSGLVPVESLFWSSQPTRPWMHGAARSWSMPASTTTRRWSLRLGPRLARRMALGQRQRQSPRCSPSDSKQVSGPSGADRVDQGQDDRLNELVRDSARMQRVEVGWTGVASTLAVGKRSRRCVRCRCRRVAGRRRSLVGATPRGFPIALVLRGGRPGRRSARSGPSRRATVDRSSTSATSGGVVARRVATRSRSRRPRPPISSFFSAGDVATTWYRLALGRARRRGRAPAALTRADRPLRSSSLRPRARASRASSRSPSTRPAARPRAPASARPSAWPAALPAAA